MKDRKQDALPRFNVGRGNIEPAREDEFSISGAAETAHGKERILLHSCCGPCSSAAAEKLSCDYEVNLYFYNPNITDFKEYELRLLAQRSFAEQFNMLHEGGRRIAVYEGPWEPTLFLDRVRGLEEEPEGGTRCEVCFRLRLEKTAEFAAAGGFDRFGTTLSVSPHKDYLTIFRIGSEIAGRYGLTWHGDDFKKKGGFQLSVELAKRYGLYRQNYCGCPFSKKNISSAADDEGQSGP